MSAFASTQDVVLLSGKNYTADQQERIEALLPLVSDALRVEATKVYKDLDAMCEESAAYAQTVRLVTVDIIIRIMRQDLDGDPMSQESQSGLGYTWSGSYAIPGGGGLAAAIMKNDLKRLGLRRQYYGLEDMYGKDTWNHGSTP